MSSLFKGKNFLIGVSGGIASYKAAELVRLLVKEGADVLVVMTENAKKFVSPLTFQALSGKPVFQDIFENDSSDGMEHIRFAREADLFLIAPATANSIAKLAHGFADDALSTAFMAFLGPVWVAPAMNSVMYSQASLKENLQTLQRRGVHVIEPDLGQLACGEVGPGRLPDPEVLLEPIKNYLGSKRDLEGVKIVVTAGPTQEPLDPVRYISNPSSGKMGYAIACRARDRGANVVLISGPTALDNPPGMEVHRCQRANEMGTLVKEHFPDCSVLVMTAAVGDFAPKTVSKEKMKKDGKAELVLNLKPTMDILMEVSSIKSGQKVVGFAAESENVIQSALDKFKRKQLDLMVANDISAPGIGFQSDFNQVTLIEGENAIETLPKLSKNEIADIILDRVANLL